MDPGRRREEGRESMTDWGELGGVAAVVGTIALLWKLLSDQLKDYSAQLKGYEERNDKAHADLGGKIADLAGKIDAVVGKVDAVQASVAYMRGLMDGERNARDRQPPGHQGRES